MGGPGGNRPSASACAVRHRKRQEWEASADPPGRETRGHTRDVSRSNTVPRRVSRLRTGSPYWLFMYTCEKCSRVVGPSQPAKKMVVQRREKHYPFRAEAMPHIDRETHRPKHDPGGVGWEIVREATVCPDCVPMIL